MSPRAASLAAVFISLAVDVWAGSQYKGTPARNHYVPVIRALRPAPAPVPAAPAPAPAPDSDSSRRWSPAPEYPASSPSASPANRYPAPAIKSEPVSGFAPTFESGGGFMRMTLRPNRFMTQRPAPVSLPDAAPLPARAPAAQTPPRRPSADMIELEAARMSPDAGQAWRWSARAMRYEQAWADSIHDLHIRGRSRTAGHPLERAALVHAQTGGTCTIVSYQEMLLEHGALPPGDPQRQEDELFEESVRKGYFNGARDGANGGYQVRNLGDLLENHGLKVIRHGGDTDEALINAVSQGRMVAAEVDPAYVWYNRSDAGRRHTIVITGLERSRETGKILAFYINDSAPAYYAGARLVPASLLLAAWRASGSYFVEAQ